MYFGNWLILGFEAAVTGVLLLALFRLRGVMGLSPLYAALGGFQLMQTLLPRTAQVPVAPGISVHPGSTVMFSAMLFVTLIVYIREDATKARNVLHGVFLANVTMAAMLLLLNHHVANGQSPELARIFGIAARVILIGTAAFTVDVIAMIPLYEWISASVTRNAWLRLFLTLAAVQTLDAALFAAASASSGGQPIFAMAATALTGKIAAGGIHSVLGVLAMRYISAPQYQRTARGESIQDFFQMLSYREKYQIYRERATRDHLTGLHNRSYLDETLPVRLANAKRTGAPMVVLMLDIDHFKTFNDTHGHAAGDRALAVAGKAMANTFRATDDVCRYGGEEFTVVCPETPIEGVAGIAAKLRERLGREWTRSMADVRAEAPTLTIGAAAFPRDGKCSGELLGAADRRLYQGKRNGRNVLVDSDEGEPAAAAAGGTG